MAHLAVLIANPRQEIRAADLVAGLAALSGAAGDGGAAHPSWITRRSPSTGTA
jgi:hypothetical protein